MMMLLGFLKITLLLFFWFIACGLLWGRSLPLEVVYWSAHYLGIYGDEDVYDFAALLGLIVASMGALSMTYFSLKILSVISK